MNKKNFETLLKRTNKKTDKMLNKIVQIIHKNRDKDALENPELSELKELVSNYKTEKEVTLNVRKIIANYKKR